MVRPPALLRGLTFLRTGAELARGREFRRVDAEGLELFLSSGPLGRPDELGIVVKGRRNERVDAFWNGCVYAP